MSVPGNHARAQQLAADAADPRNPARTRAELRELAQVHATLALTEAIDRLVPREREAAADGGSTNDRPAV